MAGPREGHLRRGAARLRWALCGASNAHQECVLLLLVYYVLLLSLTYAWLSRSPGATPANTVAVLATVIASSGVAHFCLRRWSPSADPFLLPAVTCLIGLGLTMLERLAPNFLSKQLLWCLVGTSALLFVTRLAGNLRWLRRYRYSWLLLGLFLLVLTFLFGVNPLGGSARLWLGLGGIYFQPSEFLKLAFVVFLASYLAEKQELIRLMHSRVGRWTLPPLAYLLPLLFAWGLTLLLLVAQQDLGAGALIFCIFLAMLYVTSHQILYVVGGFAVFVATGVLAYNVSPFVALRVDVWLDPWSQSEGAGYQIVQALLSFAAGGPFGTGLGHGLGATYIPIVHTDFVFAAIGEELGLVGALAVMAIYVLLLQRGFRIALHAVSPFEQLLAAGLTVSLCMQAWVIMGGNLKVLPLTGVTLPFVSYGGSSLLAGFLALALLLHISARGASHVARGAHFERDALGSLTDGGNDRG